MKPRVWCLVFLTHGVCVFSVKCLIREVVIFYLVWCLYHSSVLLNIIIIDFLMFKKL